ncbi:MAG TPA: formyltransferase family protein, partial [Pyrinomonadaceae bacterium]|nr:formyltransferase family protein [Pyrinomonadaceae bacterium]
MARVDLYLGGSLGAWALRQVDPRDVRRVFSFDAGTVEHARSLALEAHASDANSFEFDAAEFGFSVHYPRVIRPRLLSQYRKVYNLHPGFLPWGRGFYPVFWALWEGTPAGATLHEMTERVDEGPVVAQTRVAYG